MYSNSHASATPEIRMPMNMLSSVNQVETPHVGTFNNMQQGVSPFYSSAIKLQYVNPNMPVDRGIGHATTSYSANYPQPSYATPHAVNFLAPYATVDVHNSAPHLHGQGRISETSARAQMPSPTTVAYHVPPTQLHNFGNISLPEESSSIGGQSNEDWVEVGRKKLKEGLAAIFAKFRREQATLRIKKRKNNDSDKKVNSVIEKAESNITCAESIKEKEVLLITGTNKKIMIRITNIIRLLKKPNQIVHVPNLFKKKKTTRHWRVVQKRSKLLFISQNHHALPTYLKRFIGQQPIVLECI